MLFRTLTPCLALCAAGLFGCSDDPAPATDAATDIARQDTATDTPADVTPTDAGNDVGADIAPADVAPTDAGNDAGAAFSAMTTLTTIRQNCMPVVAADPLSIVGSITLTNTGSVPIGPINLTDGLVVRLLGGDTMATFGLMPATLAEVAPGRSGTVTFTKTAGSLAGDAGVTGCAIVPCGSPIRIAIPLRGTNVPEGARAASEPMTLPCTM